MEPQVNKDPGALKAILLFLKASIDGEIQGRTVVPAGYLTDAVRRFAIPFSLTEEDSARVVRHLETVYGTAQDDGYVLKGEFRHWFPDAQHPIDFYYWRRLEKYWREHSILPTDVIRSVDSVTNEILGFLGNPRDRTGWNRRRGLVMGHVQMGKTTNYSALISKAADAGYRIIIVLAGITNTLRYQTQVRLDKTFVGKSSVSDSTHSKLYEVAKVFVGEQDGYVIRHPYCGTTQISDFNMASANTTGAHEGNFADPILFVTKKNPKVLERLTEWLRSLRHGEKLDGPMLLIDDEADNASVNTNADPKLSTAINQRIRSLLHSCKQSTYVGYTATPFANIFIDPDTTDNWDREDLFPADFIKSLDPPTNYVGAQRLFADQGDLGVSCVRTIPSDYVDLLPVSHRAEWTVATLPSSLLDAVREYVLARALRIAAGDGHSHSAMLVNVSRFNAVQEQVRDHIDSFLHELTGGIEAWAVGAWQKSQVMNELRRVWDAEYEGQTDFSWDTVRSHLKGSINSISPLLVNMRGSAIDYERAPPTGLHIIGIGGLALARGLTLEGLLVSYVLRNVGAADTLLQMGRWFGYRPGFERICRIHVTPSLEGDFREVSESVEELRADFQRMALLGKTPFEFGLKVRQSPTGIAITAANKMRSAKEISLAEDFSAKHLQAYSLYEDAQINEANMAAVQRLLTQLLTAGAEKTDDPGSARVWTQVPVALVQTFLKELQLPQTEFNAVEAGGLSLIGAYIQDRSLTELKEWDIALPYVTQTSSEGDPIRFPFPSSSGPSQYCRSRTSGVRVNNLVKITAKNAVAFGEDDLSYGEDRDTLRTEMEKIRAKFSEGAPPPASVLRAMSRARPLLVVHLLKFGLTPPSAGSEQEDLRFDPSKPVVTISMVFPGTEVRCKERRYQASPRLIQLLAERRESMTGEEDPLDDE